MKKIKMKLLLLLMFVSSISYAQFYGKWVIPTENTIPSSTYLLQFNADQLNYEPLSVHLGEKEHCEIAAGAFKENYDLDFYILDYLVIFGGNTYEWNIFANAESDDFHPECQMIRIAGNNYRFFYTIKEYNDIGDDHFSYTDFTLQNNQLVYDDPNTILGGIKSGKNVSFAITKPYSGIRYLYAATPKANGMSGIIKAGIKRWTISPDGVSNMEIIVNSDHYLFNENDFNSYNLELKSIDEDDVVIAWISPDQQLCDKIFIYDDMGPEKIIDLNLGRIGGIEFSSFDDEIIYASCSNAGIVAVNYDTEQITAYLTNNKYNSTFLQTAPDGHIYGVDYDPATEYATLGRINMSTGNFEDNQFMFPEAMATVGTYEKFGNESFYILPENSETFPMQISVQTTDVSCPGGIDGSALISVTAGLEPYTYYWYILVNNQWELIPGYTTELAENLSEGTYKCIVEDAAGWTNEITFTIGVYYTTEDFITIEGNQVWTTDQRLKEGFMVTAGSQLTITNCTIELGDNAKIMVEQGASLLIDDAILCNLIDCEIKWAGIEVWGNPAMHQYEINNELQQGYVELSNNSVIENAEVGIATYKKTWDGNEWSVDWNTAGGIVKSKNTNFVNNTKSVHFIPYMNYLPGSPGTIRNNESHFRMDTFVVNNEYINTNTFYKHADMHGVKGIGFRGCCFMNDAGNETAGIATFNMGIGAYSAGFEVTSYCNMEHPDITNPCDPDFLIISSFSGFHSGIEAFEVSEQYNNYYTVEKALFTNNIIGILNSGVNFATIINSEFKVGYSGSTDAYDDCGGVPYGMGIDMQESFGFAIENDTFTKYNPAPLGEYAGIRAKDCPSPNDIIYRNHFVGLSYGNYAQGNNRSLGTDLTGLEYRCNTNIDNVIDFIVTDPIDFEEAKIRDHIGNYDTAAGNTFSQIVDNEMHIRNDGEEVISYYYYQYDPLQVPDEDKITDYFVELIDDAEENLCPDHYTGGGGIRLSQDERLQKESDYNQNLIDYNTVLSQYETLKDGGDTEAELNDVQTAQPEDMWDLRAQLLGDSPHLSQEVLMETSDRTDVFPDDVLFDILAANPDELKEDTLLSYLENKEDPLPDYMISMLRDLAIGNITYKTILKNQMADHYSRKMQAAQDIVRSILNDSVLDVTDYRNWLDNMSCLEADKQIISSYLSEDDTASAMTLMNMIPDLYELEGEDLDDFNDYEDLVLMQLNWKQNGKNLFELDSTDIAALEVYANGCSGSAMSMARSILSYAYNYNFCDCLALNDSSYYKSSHGSKWNSLNNTYGPVVKVEPNPADTWVAFNYELSSKESVGYLKISSISGEQIQQFVLYGKKGQQIWDTRTVNPGVYLYTLISNGLKSTGKIVIK